MEEAPPSDEGASPPPRQGVREEPAEAPFNNQLAPAGVGSRSPASSDPEMALAAIAALGPRVSVDQVVDLWPGQLTGEEAEAIRCSVDWEWYFMNEPHQLRADTSIKDGAEFAFALAHARECAKDRLGRTLTARQLWMIANNVRGRLDLNNPLTPTGEASLLWSEFEGPVTDVVLFITRSILMALDQEAGAHRGR